MPMECPICGYARLGEALRCPKCQSALTMWKNCDMYGRQAYRAGLHALSEGRTEAAAELLLAAMVLAPEQPVYLGAYGRVLGKLGRYREAAFVLKKAHELAPARETKAAWDMAAALAERPLAGPAVFQDHQGMVGEMPGGEPEEAQPSATPEPATDQLPGSERPPDPAPSPEAV
ncbi:MAG TPA: hypothetical protein VKA46_16425 [Gemmataceae bacterium]|nr:hypothetical protein [Gemmataceae bacterium]